MLKDDPDLFDCATCPVREAWEGLDDANREAWAMFQRLMSRFVVDLGAGSAVFARMTADVPDEAYADLVARLTVLYDIVCPPRTPGA